jgi:hypothetical protein
MAPVGFAAARRPNGVLGQYFALPYVALGEAQAGELSFGGECSIPVSLAPPEIVCPGRSCRPLMTSKSRSFCRTFARELEPASGHRPGQSRGMKSTWGPGSIMNTASVARTHATAAAAIAMWNPENS